MKLPDLSRLQALQIDTVLAGATLDAHRSRFDALRNRHENGTAPRAVSAFQLFQTPAPLAARLVSLLRLEPGARVLEPSAGLGRILDALAPYAPREVVAVEIAPQLAAELYRQERAGVVLKQRDFLACTPADLGTFDAVAMNPPFHMRADVRHIMHALDFLRPGGRLAALCMAGARRIQAFRDMAEEWNEIPAGEFRAEGTNVATYLFTVVKR